MDEKSLNGEVFANAGSNGKGRRETESAYTELSLPLANNLEMQLAERFDHYSDFGDTANPKIGFRYQVSPKLMFRASAGTGFKAPNMTDLYASSSEGYPTFIDAVNCKKDPSSGACAPHQYFVKSGGNPGLKQEESESYNLGMIAQPNRSTSFSTDFWLTKMHNVVGIDYDDLMIAERDGVDYQSHGVSIIRDSNKDIVEIDAPLQNLAARELLGVDLGYEESTSTKFGRARLRVDHSHMFFYKEEGFPGIGLSDVLGKNGHPAWKNQITFALAPTENQEGSLIVNTTAQHRKSVDNAGYLKQYSVMDFRYSVTERSE